MNYIGRVFLLFVLLSGSMVAAQSNSVTAVLQKAEVLESEDRVRWQVAVSNPSPAAIRFSHFSLASAIRAAKFSDDAGYGWQVIPPRELIDPPSPEVDFRLRVPPRSAVNLTIVTEALELLPKGSAAATTNRIPQTLNYKLERDIEVLVDPSKRSSWWRCNGSGIAQIKWASEK